MEENKVREKLAVVIHARRCGCGRICDPSNAAIADAILQSPDLRVTLVEPKYTLQTFGGNMTTVERDGKWVATFDSLFDAQTYVNSKEPK